MVNVFERFLRNCQGELLRVCKLVSQYWCGEWSKVLKLEECLRVISYQLWHALLGVTSLKRAELCIRVSSLNCVRSSLSSLC